MPVRAVRLCQTARPRDFQASAAGPDQEWTRLVESIPLDLDEAARSSGALKRRRQVTSGATLLRFTLAYAVLAWPLRLVVSVAELQRHARLSAPALLFRLRAARGFLGLVLAALLGATRATTLRRPARVRLIDATVVSRPGSTGTDWRLHLSLDLASLAIDQVTLTDQHGGESLTRFPIQPGDIGVADRGYGTRPGVGALLAAGGDVVVRISWQNFPLELPSGRPFDPFPWLEHLAPGQAAEQAVAVQTPTGRFPLRLVAFALHAADAASARRRLRQQASKKGRAPAARTLLAAGFVLLVTSLDPAAWSAEEVLALYRLRWQVELLFKRLKSIWGLDQLRARGADLAQTTLLAALIGALLFQRRTRPVAPLMLAWSLTPDRPLSDWCWQALGHATFQAILIGPLSFDLLCTGAERLRRSLCATPRRRKPTALATRRRLLEPLACNALKMA